jgi:hypothetical protein
MKDSTNDKKPTRALGIQRLDSSARKPGGNDKDWFNPCGNQAAHFVDCTKSLMLSTFFIITKNRYYI